MVTPTPFQVSLSRFMHWGRSHAQLLAVGLASVWSILYVAGSFQQLQDQRELSMAATMKEPSSLHDQREVFEARIEAVRAEATKQKAEDGCKCIMRGVQCIISHPWASKLVVFSYLLLTPLATSFLPKECVYAHGQHRRA